MTLIDSRIYLSRPHDLQLKNARALDEALIHAATVSDNIKILSAYYNSNYLKEFFQKIPSHKRKAYNITLIFGLDTRNNTVQITKDLRELNDYLHEIGFKSIYIGIFDGDVPFHSKLYYFKKKDDEPIWFIGSANASSAIVGDRHELMISLTGRHNQLSGYVKSVQASSIDISKDTTISEHVYDLRSFFLNGYLCYKPSSRLNFNFEACQIDSIHRSALNKKILENSNVPYANPQAEGFSFNLIDAVSHISNKSFTQINEESIDDSIKRINYKSKSIETIYGYWTPRPYAIELRDSLRKIEQSKLNDAKIFLEQLEKISIDILNTELHHHVKGVKNFFKARNIKIEQKNGYEQKFISFINSRKSLLANERSLESIYRHLYIEKMPDIWNDEESSQKFERSFFNEFSIRLIPERKSKIVQHLYKKLKLSGFTEPNKIRSILKNKLRKGLDDSMWIIQ